MFTVSTERGELQWPSLPPRHASRANASLEGDGFQGARRIVPLWSRRGRRSSSRCGSIAATPMQAQEAPAGRQVVAIHRNVGRRGQGWAVSSKPTAAIRGRRRR